MWRGLGRGRKKSCPVRRRRQMMLLQERDSETQKKGLQEVCAVKQKEQEIKRGDGSIFQNAKPELFMKRKELKPGIESRAADREVPAEMFDGIAAEEIRSENGEDKEEAVGSMGNNRCR